MEPYNKAHELSNLYNKRRLINLTVHSLERRQTMC